MKLWRLALLSCVSVVVLASESHASVPPSELEANRFIYYQNDDVIEASGKVLLTQEGQSLRADRLIYNIADDFAYAEGNVVFADGQGDTHYAERLELSDQMRRGLVQNIYTEMEDGSRLWADRAVRESETLHQLKDARYTPCRACEDNPDETPVWALRASEVTHDKQDATISYDNVRFEAWGVPIAYAPYFSHPDGTVKQKSGFLSPEIGFGSEDGFNFMSPYYWAISPSLDATLGLRVFSKAAPQLNLETRKRFEDAFIQAQTSFTYSDRTDSVDGLDVFRDDELRGHIDAQALWNIDRRWRAGAEIRLSSDEQYLDQYDISDEDVLDNRLYLERFHDRDYTSIELLAFQDLRLDQEVDQPNALPFIQNRFVGMLDGVFGGRWQWDSSYLTLYRNGNEQDMNRLSSSLSWQRKDIAPLGLVSTLDLQLRGDAYYTTDRDAARLNPNEDDEKFDSRAIPTANWELSLPLQKRVTNASLTLKPRVSVTARPDIDNDSDIPNEDSIDTQINYTNLFDIDRFAGLDRVEDRSRVTYALEGGYHMDNGSALTAAIGQSYRFDDTDNPFANGSGFEQQSSDVVGQVGASFNNHRHNLNYRFQLDGQTLNAERHEFYGGTTMGRTSLSAIYLYERGTEGTEFPDSRQQIQARIVQGIDENWTMTTSALYDLGEDEGLRQAIAGLAYDDDCFGITAELRRELQREATGADDTAVILRFRLKNLGEFETTAYDEGSGDLDNTLVDEGGN